MRNIFAKAGNLYFFYLLALHLIVIVPYLFLILIYNR